jgi:hypothetical protein
MRIDASVLKAVQELLIDRGIPQKPDERIGDYIARGLGVSDAKANAFIEYLHEGASVQEAKARAGLEIEGAGHTLLIDIARAIGSALGRMSH